MKRMDNPLCSMESAETIQLKADLWMEVAKVFEEKELYPWLGDIHVQPNHDRTKNKVREMALSISTIFLTKEAYVIHGHFDVPETWWQHFKESYFPKWILKRFPVKTKKLKYTENYHRICPHMDIPAKSNMERNTHISWLRSPLKGRY